MLGQYVALTSLFYLVIDFIEIFHVCCCDVILNLQVAEHPLLIIVSEHPVYHNYSTCDGSCFNIVHTYFLCSLDGQFHDIKLALFKFCRAVYYLRGVQRSYPNVRIRKISV